MHPFKVNDTPSILAGAVQVQKSTLSNLSLQKYMYIIYDMHIFWGETACDKMCKSFCVYIPHLNCVFNGEQAKHVIALQSHIKLLTFVL